MKKVITRASTCFSLLLLCLLMAPSVVSAEDVEVYRDYEFRDTLRPDFITRLDPTPWKPEEKVHVKEMLGWLYAEYPGFMKHIAQYGTVSLYRTRKRQLDYTNQPAYAGLRMVSFFDYDPTNTFAERTIYHELTHVSDTYYRLANGKEWRALIEPRIEKILKWQKDKNIQKPFTGWGKIEESERTILWKTGLPSFYAASSPVEALAEIVSYMIMNRKHGYSYEPPSAIKAYIEKHVLSHQIDPYPAGQHYYQGLLLSRKTHDKEALLEYEKAVAADPKFLKAYLGLASARYWQNSGKPKGWEQYKDDLLKIQEMASPFNKKLQLWLYETAVNLMGKTGEREKALEICEKVNQDFPPDSRTPREYAAYKLCGDAYYLNGKLPEALEQYEKSIKLVPFKQYEMTNRIGNIRMALAETEEEKWAAHDKTIVEMWQPLAEKGQPAAMLTLGKMYLWGTQAPKDYMEAVKWLTKAFHEKQTEAGFYLSTIYNTGHGLVEKDPELARHWARVAAQAGDQKGQYMLGLLQIEDHAIDEGIGLLKNAAKQGHREAAYELGNIFMTGRYGQQNKDNAVTWYTKAVNKRHTKSMYELARYYLAADGSGESGAKDKAFSLFFQAAKQGDAESQFYLGTLLMKRKPAQSQTDKAAYQWLYTSVNNPDLPDDTKSEATTLLSELEATIPSEQLKLLKQQVDEYIKKNNRSIMNRNIKKSKKSIK